MLQRKYGHLSMQEKETRVLWCFNVLPTTGWFWLEKHHIRQKEKGK